MTDTIGRPNHLKFRDRLVSAGLLAVSAAVTFGIAPALAAPKLTIPTEDLAGLCQQRGGTFVVNQKTGGYGCYYKDGTSTTCDNNSNCTNNPPGANPPPRSQSGPGDVPMPDTIALDEPVFTPKAPLRLPTAGTVA